METWTVEEDRLLVHLIDVHGTFWKVIAQSFPSRSTCSIRNRYQRIVNGSKHIGKNRCRKCGMIRRGHICRGDVPDGDGALRLHPVIQMPSFLPLVNTELGHDVDEDVVEGDDGRDGEGLFPSHPLSRHAMQTANDMGFEDVMHPPLVVHEFPFTTSLPCEGAT